MGRDPLTVPHRLRNDAFLAAAVAVTAVALVFWGDEGRRPDVLGWTLLTCSVVALVWRHSRPVLVLLAVLACVVPYHAADNSHFAAVPGSLVAVYTVAVTRRPLHALLIGAGVISLAVTVMFQVGAHEGQQALRTSGWILSVLILGVDLRTYRRYIASVVGRAERAERTREEEAARRVAEERLRIARDLHDLLAHSITLIGVQTSVASHVLLTDPERLDRAAIAKALDDVSETCRSARGELRTTLEVLRSDRSSEDPLPAPAALPDLAAVPDLVRAAEAAGASVDLTLPAAGVRPAAAAAAYRIVQEALTNAVRHAGPGVRIRVRVLPVAGTLRVTVSDDGSPHAGAVPAGGGRGSAVPGAVGFGLIGMRERARSLGGTLAAGPRPDGGFEVCAVLPLLQEEGTV
ncbi:histidine kinase [Streptomyces sp. NBC_00344]